MIKTNERTISIIYHFPHGGQKKVLISRTEYEKRKSIFEHPNTSKSYEDDLKEFTKNPNKPWIYQRINYYRGLQLIFSYNFDDLCDILQYGAEGNLIENYIEKVVESKVFYRSLNTFEAVLYMFRPESVAWMPWEDLEIEVKILYVYR